MAALYVGLIGQDALENLQLRSVGDAEQLQFVVPGQGGVGYKWAHWAEGKALLASWATRGRGPCGHGGVPSCAMEVTSPWMPG